MKLYQATASPFARKVRAVLHETGLIGRVEIVDVVVSPLDPGRLPLGLSPLGKIPVLERPEGPALYDSGVICRYLADLGGGGLVPPAPRLWETLTLEAMADGICDAAVLMVYEARTRPEDRRSEEWVAAQWSKVARALDALDDRWLAHLAGPLDLGQIAMGCALGYLDFRHSERGWRDGRPGLAAWEAGFARRASMQATRPS